MKSIIIGDTHGRTDWKHVIKQEFDRLVFIGDYFDTHENISGEQQIENFKDIVKYKENNMDKVTLLIGNHDFHYLDVNERYSGFQPGYQYMISHLLKENLHLLQICIIVDNILCSHAGVTNTWLQRHLPAGDESVVDRINSLFIYQPYTFKFDGYNNYGDDITQGPLWVRPKSLEKDMYEMIQVVGHTVVPRLEKWNKGSYPFYTIDCIGTSHEYLEVIDNHISIKKVDYESH